MLRVLSLFSGIGAFETALRRGGYQFETVNYCEIDPYASKAYSQIHGISEDYNLKDVRQVNTLLMDNINLMTWGWPCQDISVAGKQRGFKDNDGNLTRSGLFFHGLRILTELQPEYAIAENVKALTGKKFTAEFETVLTSLDKAGYNNYWKVLNAKDYGIPQNRERVFIVSIRKDVDNGGFKFPEKMPLNIRVKDILESNVDEKFYINTDKAKELIKKFVEKNQINEIDQNPKIQWCGSYNGHQSGNVVYERGICNCIDVAGHVEPQKIMIKKDSVKQIGNIVTTGNFENPQRGRIYDSEGISPCLNTMQGGGLEPKFIEPVICASRGRNPDNPSDRTAGIPTEQRLEPNTDGVSNTLTTVQKDNYLLEPKKILQPVVIGSTQQHAAVKDDGICTCLTEAMGAGGGHIPMITDNQQNDCSGYRIRKLTPRECFRLMGFTDADFDKIKGISNTQLYKMAGNSIVVNVLEGIFRELFKAQSR